MISAPSLHAKAKSAESPPCPASPAIPVPDRTPSQTSRWLAFLSDHAIHPKLEVSDPDDADEREADAAADRVMRMTGPGTPLPSISSSGPGIARACSACAKDDEDRPKVARKASALTGIPPAHEAAAEATAAVAGGGVQLGHAERAWFEPRFGRDLSDVRIHTGAQAQAAAAGIAARAYTYGRNIAFAAGQYRPETTEGRRLIAHELAHTLQQGSNPRTIARETDLEACMNQTDDILPPRVGLVYAMSREQELADKLGADYAPLKALIKRRPEARSLVCFHGVPGVLALAKTKTPQGILDLPAAQAVLNKQPVPQAPTATALPATAPAAGAADFKVDREESSTAWRIMFGRDGSTLTTDDQVVIKLAKTRNAAVDVVGYASADEAPAIAQTRADIVKSELEKAPDAITVSSATGNAAATASRPNFARARSAEIVLTGQKAVTKDCKAKDKKGNPINPPTQACKAMDPPTETAFKGALAIANDAMGKAIAAVTGAPSAENATLIDRFFGNHDPPTLATLQTNLTKLSAHVTGLPKITNCGGECDISGCAQGTIAYNSDVDAASRMTICVPRFKDLGSDDDRARNLIHESAHGTSALGGPAAPTKGTIDVAYRHNRLFTELKPEDRLRNSDSYALFALFVREGAMTGKPPVGPAGTSKPQNDNLPYTDQDPEKKALKFALGLLEKRLGWADDNVGQLYGEVVAIRARKQTWEKSFADRMMTEAAKVFGLTAPNAKPTLRDQTMLAAILERYSRMYKAVKRDLTITRMASGTVAWDSASGAEPWFAGASFKIGPDFFRADEETEVALLMEQLAKATKDIETAFIPAYLHLAKWIHEENLANR